MGTAPQLLPPLRDYTGPRFYRYYFEGIRKPVQIEAVDQQSAWRQMDIIFPNLPDIYRQAKLLGETVTVPLDGITIKKEKGQTFIWVGAKSPNGWMSEAEFSNGIGNDKHSVPGRPRNIIYAATR